MSQSLSPSIVFPESIHPAATPALCPQFSIVIPALNEQLHIARCLRSLVALGVSNVPFEVLLVDNGSTDRTLEIAASFYSSLDLTIHRRAGVRISSLRNHGVAQSTASIVVFLDADCVVPPLWLQHVAAASAQVAEDGIIGSKYEIPPHSRWVARAWERGQAGSTRRLVRYVPGGAMVMHRSIFLRLGGFDESLTTNEDAELCKRARDQGFSVTADPVLAVIHHGTSQTLHTFYRRQHWHGTHVLKVFLRAPFRSGNEKAVLLAFYTLVLEFCVAAGVIRSFLTGRWYFLALTLALIVAPAVLLALARIRHTRALFDFPRLVVLFSVYGFARAHCIISSNMQRTK